MAAYAALVSLSHILHHILHPPPLNKIIIDRQQIEFLRVKVDFLIKFLETYPSRSSAEIKDLQMQIADAACAAQDIIESNVVSQFSEEYAIPRAESSALIRRRIKLKGKEVFRSMARKFGKIKYEKEIRRMVKEFHSIEEELKKIQDNKGMEDPQPKNSTTTTSSRPLPSGEITMVGFEKHMNELMGALASDESNHQIIPILGMGGIGKTTLATAIYSNPFIVEHFYFRAWVTISQEYIVRELLIRLLCEINKSNPNQRESTDDEIGELLYKELYDRKYLIVMDDMWDIVAWDKVKRFFPRNNNGSRILVTTRLLNLADKIRSSGSHQIGLLDEEKGWDLLRGKVFGKEDCPVELEEIGKNIAKKCRGLPLALVVIGGLLAKSERTKKHWRSVEGDVTSAINYGNDDHLMEILSLSYSHLPVYLKPCFLYLSVFPEDFEIRVFPLVGLWVAEGLIKQTPAKCLEEVAHEYLEDLISRNLILIHKRGSSGNVRSCKIHDLLRELCRREAEKEKLVYIAKLDNPNLSSNIKTKRCVSISSCKRQEITAIEALQSARFNRSLLSHGKLLRKKEFYHGFMGVSSEERELVNKIIHGFRLLKVVHVEDSEIQIDISKLINLRYVVRSIGISSMSLCWNLQTLVVHDGIISLPAEIWQMPQLRHLKMKAITLPDPPPDDQNVIVLENLQTLKGIKDFKCTKEVPKRIPNLKKLRISYDFRSSAACEQIGNYCLKNLVCFKKLESLRLDGAQLLWTDIALPISLKKLSLSRCWIPWENLSIVGSLPNLEVLKLFTFATKGEEWNPFEGEFCRLKFLWIGGCELKIWGAEDYHFPCLEHLVLGPVKLQKIPKSFAEILTLQVIELYSVRDSIWKSARKISDQQELLGYEPLQIRRH